MTQCIAFHSYKGGTGKTTIATNLAAMLTARGYNVALLDLDVYAPGLHAYFDHNPENWINDLLFDNAETKEVMADMTHVIQKYAGNLTKTGKLWIGFSNPLKEEIYKLDGGGKQTATKIQLLRKFIQLREDLMSDYNCDYVIIDTSPGIRYWSINSLAIADTLFLTLKFDDPDIKGTEKMANDIYSSFTKFGAKSYLLLNRISGYCVPSVAFSENKAYSTMTMQNTSNLNDISHNTAMEVVSAIPCYCDIQFKKKEFLTVLEYPDHPFSNQLERLASTTIKV